MIHECQTKYCLCVLRYYRESPDNTVSISTVGGLTQVFFLKDIARIPPLSTVFITNTYFLPLKIRIKDPFLLLVTLNENIWVEKIHRLILCLLKIALKNGE